MPDEIIEALVPDENEEILEDIDEAAEDVDELVVRLTELAATSETRHAQIISEVERCRTELTKLSNETLTAENPLLTQILTQLIEMRAELMQIDLNLKSLADTRLRNREPNDSQMPELEQPPDASHDETLDNLGENGDPTSGQRAKKNRFV